MVIGAVSDTPVPVEEMVSGAVVTEVSPVGNGPLPNDGAAAGLPAGGATGLVEGCEPDATTDSSVVGNTGGALVADDAAGEAEAVALALAGSGFGSTVRQAIASC